MVSARDIHYPIFEDEFPQFHNKLSELENDCDVESSNSQIGMAKDLMIEDLKASIHEFSGSSCDEKKTLVSNL